VSTRKMPSELDDGNSLCFRRPAGEDTSEVRLLHELAKIGARFDDPYLMLQAGGEELVHDFGAPMRYTRSGIRALGSGRADPALRWTAPSVVPSWPVRQQVPYPTGGSGMTTRHEPMSESADVSAREPPYVRKARRNVKSADQNHEYHARMKREYSWESLFSERSFGLYHGGSPGVRWDASLSFFSTSTTSAFLWLCKDAGTPAISVES